jgi:hypothetical protein
MILSESESFGEGDLSWFPNGRPVRKVGAQLSCLEVLDG